MAQLPALFIGHGSPMNTLELNGYTDAWRAMGEHAAAAARRCSSSRPTGISARPQSPRCLEPRTIHDFYGFPPALSSSTIRRRARPSSRRRSRKRVKPHWCGLDHDQWGLDHGTWSVLAHLYPKADIPVVQLSINALKPLDLSCRARREAGAAARSRRHDPRQRQRRPQSAPGPMGQARRGVRLGRAFRRGGRREAGRRSRRVLS